MEQNRLSIDEIKNIIESLLFVTGEPIAIKELSLVLEVSEAEASSAVAALEAEYAQGKRGIALQRVEDKVRMTTNRAYAKYVEALLQPEQNKVFSQSLVETLAIIAYKQPITRAEIEAVRGVRCEYAVAQLIQMGLVEDKGRKNTIGRPVLLGTTDKFLQQFDLPSLGGLPGLIEEELEGITV